MSLQSVFADLYKSIELEVENNPAWNNGTDYMDNLANSKINLPAGSLFKYEDRGRKAIAVVTPVGQVVVFERYTNDPQHIVRNVPQVLHGLYGGDNRVTEADLIQAFGYLEGQRFNRASNVGTILAGVLKHNGDDDFYHTWTVITKS